MVSDGGHSDLRMWRLSCIKQRQINRNSDRVLELYVSAVFVCLRGAKVKIAAICWYGRSMISLSWTLQNWLLPGTSRRNATALWCEFFCPGAARHWQRRSGNTWHWTRHWLGQFLQFSQTVLWKFWFGLTQAAIRLVAPGGILLTCALSLLHCCFHNQTARRL